MSSAMSAPLEISGGWVRLGTPSVTGAVFSPEPLRLCPTPADTSVRMLLSMVNVLFITPGARGIPRPTGGFLFLSLNLWRGGGIVRKLRRLGKVKEVLNLAIRYLWYLKQCVIYWMNTCGTSHECRMQWKEFVWVITHFSSSSCVCANVQLVPRGQPPCWRRSRHMLVLYLLLAWGCTAQRQNID